MSDRLAFEERIELALVLLTMRSRDYVTRGGDSTAPVPEAIILSVVNAWKMPYDRPEDFRDNLVLAWNAQQDAIRKQTKGF